MVGALVYATREGNVRLVHALATEAGTRVRRRAEEVEALRLYRLLVASVVDYAIFALDPEGHVLTWNAGAERLKGYAPGEILGRHFSAFYTPEDRAAGRPERLLREAVEMGHVEDEGWRVRKDGSRFWARVTLTALRDADGTLRGVAKVTRDLTERKAAEDAARAANADLERHVAERTRDLQTAVESLRAANTSLDAFSFVVSHDLKEPVRALHALLDALRSDHGARLEPDALETLDRAIGAERRLAGLVDDLLEWSRAGRLESAATRAVSLVEAFAADATRVRFEDAARGRGATLDSRLRADHAVRGSPAALSLILGNLVLNAVKHNPRPDPVVRVRSDRRVRPDGRAEVEVVVEDNGPGFSPESLSRFENLATHKGESLHGTGFGLAIVRRAVERLGGTMRLAASAEEGGAAVHITLPAA